MRFDDLMGDGKYTLTEVLIMRYDVYRLIRELEKELDIGCKYYNPNEVEIGTLIVYYDELCDRYIEDLLN